MWRKRTIHTLLGGVLVLTSISNVPALAETNGAEVYSESITAVDQNTLQETETKITREEAQKIAEKYFTIPEGYEGPHISRETSDYEGGIIWSLRWTKDSPSHGSINISIDANTGFVLNYHQYDDERNKNVSIPPETSYDDAVKIARDFVNRIYGEKDFHLEYREQPWNEGQVIRNPQDSYHIIFQSVINGIPYSQNSVSVSVDGNGNITSLYANMYDRIRFESADGVKSQDEMEKFARENLFMKKVYRYKKYFYFGAGEQEKPEIVVAYQPAHFGQWDAEELVPIDYEGNEVVYQHESMETLAEEPLNEPSKPLEKPVTEEEALEIVEKFADIPDEIQISAVRYVQNNPNGSPTWNIQFEYQYDHGGFGWDGAIVDAHTGRIIRFNLDTYYMNIDRIVQGEKDVTDEGKGISIEEAKEIALDYVKEQSGDKVHQLALIQYNQQPVLTDNSRLYSFHFARVVNGIQVEPHYVRVSVLKENGDVIGFDENWDWNASLPEVEGTISADEAKEIYLNSGHFQLEYRSFGRDFYQKRRQGETVDAYLVYSFIPVQNVSYYIDAFNGELINMRDGKPVSAQDPQLPEDLEGHWAKTEMNYLMKLGALKEAEDGKIYPDRVVSRAEFLNMLAYVVGRGLEYYRLDQKIEPSFDDVNTDHKYFAAINWALENKIIDEGNQFNPDGDITRQQAATWIVNALGLQALVEKDDYYHLPFTDSNQITDRGSVAIVNILEIMNGYNQQFRPDDSLTRAEAAIVLIRYMNKRGQLQNILY